MREIGAPTGRLWSRWTRWTGLSRRSDRRPPGSLELAGGGSVELATPAARFGARVFDLLVVVSVDAVITFVSTDWGALFEEAQSATPSYDEFGPRLGIWWATIAVWLIYEVVPVALWGRTLGKRVTGIKVVHARTGESPGWGRALLRWLVPSALAAIYFGHLVGEMWWILCHVSLMWDRRHRGWHDWAAGTLVVKSEVAHERG